ncbi:DNA-directed RNA polymerase subunit A' [Candidatus Woesearchaeota archaeon]|nr:DNA-directed RNA polymerase subunit A' [Candidatus Woesearchaeota archaeon]
MLGEDLAAEGEKKEETSEAPKKSKIDVSDQIYAYKRVDTIGFGMFSPKLVKKMASAKIVTPELYDKEGYPVDGGLMDIRLGVIDPGLKCKTCGSKLKECPGHFGYIELARPIIHIKYIPLIYSILKSTCRECGRVLVPKNKIGKFVSLLAQTAEEEGESAKRKKISSVVSEMKSINKCPWCRARQQKIILEKPTTFMENDRRLTPIDIRTRLEKIPDDDCALFGINSKIARPEWAVLTVLAIPPVTMRPSITLESGERSEDDLTHKLGDIVRINQRLFENINAGAPEIIIEDLWDLLQYHVTTFFDNNVAQLPPARHRSGQPLKTITERIKSKEGRIRYNLAGKRTNFSARTVISPDPRLEIDEVGVPETVAMKLTVPELVTPWNMAYLRRYLEKGPASYPGANYIVRPDGKKKKITDETKEQIIEEIQPGYSVERHLLDGDVAIFNRQPSLHRMSMMCHRVKVLPFNTFRLSPAVCAPYNADFDGDEMNLHIPQTEEARAEAEILMEVETQLISPRYGLSIIGCVQDSISGNYVLTKLLNFTRDDAISLLFDCGITDFSSLPRKASVSGKEIFSATLPNDFSFEGTTLSGEKVIIKEGKLIEGYMDKNNLGEGSGLLLRNMHKRYGARETIRILGNIFKLGTKVLQRFGLSVPISDTDLPEDARMRIREILDKADKDAADLVVQYREGHLEAFPGRSVAETLELRILELLNKARNETGKVVVEHCDKNTSTLIMALSGARGNLLNLAQMAACVGQQAMRGKRIEKGYTDTTLSVFKKNDLSPEARGFIRAGFKSGLTPAEFFFMGMTGRDSLMDTALRTPKSGYLYRRLANAMQDLKVEYDYTVRDSGRNIIQFMFGEDGVDVSRSENGRINIQRIIDSVK